MENQALKAIRKRLLENARNAKATPGVYLMKSEAGVLYVGKAKNLRNRLLSYFQGVQHEHPRTERMLTQVHDFEVILTETEVEALILEATLIKKFRPRFNIRLKDDKAYPYLKIRMDQAFPRLEWARRMIQEDAQYFGPFPSAWAARQVMHLLSETFRLRDCSDNTFKYRSRPCILHQMQKCSAPCVNLISESEYREGIEASIRVLSGKTERMIQTLREGMHKASESEKYEEAAQYRDQIKNLEIITQTQGVLQAGSQKSRYVLGLARRGQDTHGTVLHVAFGKLVSVHHFSLENTDGSLSDGDILFNFLFQHYLNLKEKQGVTEVLLPLVPSEFELLERTLQISLCSAVSEVDEQLLNVARMNAEYALDQKQSRWGGHADQTLAEISRKFHLAKIPHRIECYDISNTQGQDAVASRVVFLGGSPQKDLYRRYKIKTVEGANDFAMMKEVLRRRFSRFEEDFPDLLVVDGGKGQLAQAVDILEELSVQGVGLIALAKARVEGDFKDKEVRSSSERVFIPNRKNPISLLPHTGVYKLLTHLRDEAHRFAVSYHRLLRSKRSLKTESE